MCKKLKNSYNIEQEINSRNVSVAFYCGDIKGGLSQRDAGK
jgi:hypothetical protein